MRPFLNVVLIIVFPLFSFAQSGGDYLHNRYAIERIASGTGLQSGNIVTMGTPPPGMKGDVYLNRHFNNVVFQLYDGDRIVEGYLAKLDLKQNEFDVMVPHGVKVLKGSMIKSFIFIDSLTKFQTNYVNIREWRTKEKSLYDGFIEILAEGNLTLAKRTELIVKKPDFNPALNVGSKDYRFLKREHLYYIMDRTLNELPGKKNFVKIFGGAENQIEKFISSNNLSISKIGDLIQIFDFYNGK
jgi:hypothetical protein